MPDLIGTVLIYGCLSQCPIFSASSIRRRYMQPTSALCQGCWFTRVDWVLRGGKKRRERGSSKLVAILLTKLKEHFLASGAKSLTLVHSSIHNYLNWLVLISR